jgi:quercetin dioxygenase-like cupin family protein
MPIQVLDFRRDIRNLLVTPQIRARFLRLEPGAVADRHSHDLGHEIFLILQGRAVFEIEGEEAELGPGQLCYALADEIHQVRVISDEPVIMYLSVTPHIQPTHTGRDADGKRAPTRFMPSSAYDVATDTQSPVAELLARYDQATQTLADAAATNAQRQRHAAQRLQAALEDGDLQAAAAEREAMWHSLRDAHRALDAADAIWNDLAPRTGNTG